ncbi:MAG: DMP19 family protein [Planctomycetota bacterium]
MTPADLLTEFSIKIYEPPLCEMRDDGQIRDPSNPIAVLMLVVDFETEVSMNGISNFIGNSTGLFANETVAALEIIGCDTQAAQLERILAIATDAGITHEAIQHERSGLPEYAITSFSELHGDKWNAASDEIQAVESEMDYSGMMSRAEDFVRLHVEAFRKALGHNWNGVARNRH